MLVYGANPAAQALVQSAVTANPALYGQGDPTALAPQEDRVRADLALLTEHGFMLPYLHHAHPRIDMPGGFGFEQKTIPADGRFSGLGADYKPRHYRPDDPQDFQQFEAARTEADSLGYQFYRAKAPFGPAMHVVDLLYGEPTVFDGILDGQIGGVRLYNPYHDEGTPHEQESITIRRYLDFNPEFARFAGFKHGWRSKPQFQWTYWDMLQAQSEATADGFAVDGTRGWRLDFDFGIQAIYSDDRTSVVSLTNSSGERAFITLQDALNQVHLQGLPRFVPEQRHAQESVFGNRGYLFDPEDRIKARPMMSIKMGGFGGMSGSISIPRKAW